jgi:heme/copper-type cytochrome/quinol oxidase subunit 4
MLGSILRVFPFVVYRRRASELSANYIGNYRGSFLLNYLFAALAVMLATIALTLMIRSRDLSLMLLVGIAVLALVKLFLVVRMFATTHAANRHRWSEQAADMRYLSERLRPLAFMMPLGSLRPPRRDSEQYSTRIEKQSIVDWMAEAIMRDLPALEALGGMTETNTVRANPLATLRDHCLPWIEHQLNYHASNTVTLARMNDALEKWTWICSVSVIAVVCLDIALLLFDGLKYVRGGVEQAEWFPGALLVGLTAILPAWIASLNGIRFQSECHRLADRSRFMRNILLDNKQQIEGLVGDITADQNGESRLSRGSWTLAALNRGEVLAKFTVGEAADWSVLYAKHMFDT